MKNLFLSEPISKYIYIMAQKNDIDLKYLCSPQILVSEEYLTNLPYIDKENPKIDIKKVSNDAFKYHHFRTEKNQAHRIKERNIRIYERDNDPFYWLSIFYKVQQQMKTTLVLNYRNSGFSKIKNSVALKHQIDQMEEAIEKIKNCKGYGVVFNINNIPSVITIQNEKVIPQTLKGKEVEIKYAEFCKKYNIDFKYVCELGVFDVQGEQYDEDFLRRLNRMTYKRRYIWSSGDLVDYELNYDDNARTLAYYYIFFEARASLRNIIAKYKEDGLAGTLNKKQLENLNKYVAISEKAFRLMTLSKHYKIGYQISDAQEFEKIMYNGSEIKEEQNNQEVDKGSIDADTILLELHRNACELQSKIENEKRKLMENANQRERIKAEQQRLSEEEADLTEEYNGIVSSIDNMELEYEKVQSELSKMRK